MKNERNCFYPVWLKDDNTVMDEIVCLISKSVAASENVIEEKFEESKEHVVQERPSRLIGPLFNIFEDNPS